MGLLKTKALIERVTQAQPAEAQGPAIPAGTYRARIIDASNARGNANNIYVKVELFAMNDIECKGPSVRKIAKVFDLDGQYGESEAGDFISLLGALRLAEKAATIEAKDLLGAQLIVGVETLANKDANLFNVIARGGWWDAELNHVEFEPRDQGQGHFAGQPTGRRQGGRFERSRASAPSGALAFPPPGRRIWE